MLGALDVPVLLACTVRIKSTGEATNVAIHAPKIANVLRKGNSDGLFFPLDVKYFFSIELKGSD